MEQNRNPMNYANGKIYTIRSYQTDEIYIGSTTQSLSKRLSCHKADYNKWKNGKCHYVTSFKLLDYDDVYIELLEEYPCDNRAQLEKKEGEYIRKTDKCVNKNITGRTKKEYNEMNKDKIKTQKQAYYIENKDILSQKHKVYHDENKEHLLEKGREYYNINKALIDQKHREYYNKNKDRLNEKINCECGGVYNSTHKARHFKTLKHMNYCPEIKT
jgi:hypothetical protein